METPEPQNGDEIPPHRDPDPWYSWSRWRWYGVGMFLILSSVGVGYVIWDIIDQLPKPITLEMARAALRQEPGRIADALAMSVYISFGPPAGVDLMLGATKAAEAFAKRVDEEIARRRAASRAEGVAEGRAGERKQLRKRLEAIVENHPDVQQLPEVQQLIDELEDKE